MANNQRQWGQFINYILGNGAPAPYMSLNWLEDGKDWLAKQQAKYFPNQYNNMLYYIPDVNDPGANALANRMYNGY